MTTFFSNMRIAKKLPIAMIGLVVFSVLISTLIGAWLNVKDSLYASQLKTLAVTELKKANILDYLDGIEQDLVITADSGYTESAVVDFADAWQLIEGDRQAYLYENYLYNVQNAADRINTVKPSDGSVYSEFHAEYHTFFRTMLEKRKYYDIFLFDTLGNLIYSVYKEPDFATNMYDGEWSNTAIADVYKMALGLKEGEVVFVDFQPYEPSGGVPAGFIATPIEDNGEIVGVLAFQMPISEINHVMERNEGEEESAKHLLVGEDFFLRNNPYLGGKDDKDVILVEKVEDKGVYRAFENVDKEKAYGYGLTDEHVYGYDVVQYNGVVWAIMTKVDRAEIMAPIFKAQIIVLGIAAVIIVFVTFISILVARTIYKPLAKQVNVMAPLSNGDFSVEVPDQTRGDEIGDIARAVQTFKENGMRMKELEAEQERQKELAAQEKKEAQLRLADDFDGRVGGVIVNLSDAADTMSAMAQQMQIASQQTAEISATVAASSTEADANVQTVAAATEELSASSSEIARQIDEVAKKASSAADDAQTTSVAVKELNTLADSIGEVIGTIADIAEQTNLLALNATIEAARAGEAGKGFAVVADEVKKLANETATKTEEIDERVNRIQEAIRNSVSAMDKIIVNVSEIDSATASVASAVEEQNAATAEIGRNVTEASTGTQQVSSSIIQVQQNAAESGEASSSVLQSATDLKSQSDVLKEEVNKFLAEIRGDAKTDNSEAT